MAAANKDDTLARKLVENLQTDLRSLSAEARKKHPNIKEVYYFMIMFGNLVHFSITV